LYFWELAVEKGLNGRMQGGSRCSAKESPPTSKIG
jgi:hypothetical protein